MKITKLQLRESIARIKNGNIKTVLDRKLKPIVESVLNGEESKVFTDIKPEILKEKANILKIKKDFDKVKKTLSDLYSTVNKHNLPGKRQPKIVDKLLRWPGDISPAMLESLIKEVESL